MRFWLVLHIQPRGRLGLAADPPFSLPVFDSQEAAEAWRTKHESAARVQMVDTAGTFPQVLGPEA